MCWEILTLQSPEVTGSCRESAAQKVWLAPSTTPWLRLHINYSPSAFLPRPWILFSTADDAQLLSWFPSGWAGHSRPVENIQEASFLFISVFDCQRSSTRKACSTLTSVMPSWGTWHLLQHLQALLSSFGRQAQHKPLRVIEEIKWEANDMWLGVREACHMAGSCKLHISFLLDNYIFHLPTIWSGDLFFPSLAQIASFSLFITFSVLLKEESRLGKEMACGAGMKASVQNGQFSTLLLSFPCPVLNTAVRTRGSLKRLFWLMECSCIKLEICPKILEGGR